MVPVVVPVMITPVNENSMFIK